MSQSGVLAAMWFQLRRDLLLAYRRRTDIVTGLFFFIIVVSLFPLGVTPELDVLRNIAPGIVWVAALLASMLSLSRLFADDYRDGTLEQMMLASQPLSLLVLSKVFAHWLISGLPLVLISPLMALQFDLSQDAMSVLLFALFLGTPVLSLVGAVGAALTLGVRGGGVLISVLVLPLYVPVLVFGAGAVEATVSGLGGDAHLSLLGAFLVMTVLLAPWATAAALRIMVD